MSPSWVETFWTKSACGARFSTLVRLPVFVAPGEDASLTKNVPVPVSTTRCVLALNEAVTPVVAVTALIFATRLVPTGGATPSSSAAPGGTVIVEIPCTPLTEPLIVIEKLPVLSAAGATAKTFGVASVVGAGEAGRPCAPYTTAPARLIAPAAD